MSCATDSSSPREWPYKKYISNPFWKTLIAQKIPKNLESVTFPNFPGFTRFLNTSIEPKTPAVLLSNSRNFWHAKTTRSQAFRHSGNSGARPKITAPLPERIHGTNGSVIFTYIYSIRFSPSMWVNIYIYKVAQSLETFNWYKAIRNEEFHERRVPSFNDMICSEVMCRAYWDYLRSPRSCYIELSNKKHQKTLVYQIPKNEVNHDTVKLIAEDWYNVVHVAQKHKLLQKASSTPLDHTHTNIVQISACLQTFWPILYIL